MIDEIVKIVSEPIVVPTHYVVDKKSGEVTWIGSAGAELAYWRGRALKAESRLKELDR